MKPPTSSAPRPSAAELVTTAFSLGLALGLGLGAVVLALLQEAPL